jgi:predicted Rossmann fold flavoprotein
MKIFDVIIAGGGAAGFFTAINLAELRPDLKIAILERGKETLTKVRISGGGRCNVTHACFIPNDLAKFYPRGEKELRGPFHTFASGDTIEWFEKHGVELKIEDDGRMFPVSDSSQTIIDCFLDSAKKLGIQILIGHSIQSIFKSENGWKLDTPHENFACKYLVMATGSNPKMWDLLAQMGHTIAPPVPSLFTFNIKDPRIKNLPGISANATVKVLGTKLTSSGPLLITHWGMSGPAILKLSAWGARELFAMDYKFRISVNWTGTDTEDAIEILRDLKGENAKKTVSKKSPFDSNGPIENCIIPNRLWESLTLASGIPSDAQWANLSKSQLQNLAGQLTAATFQVDGKSTFKEEFVTAGGVDLKEIDFKTMKSKILDNLYFAGEVVNIDAITGGFNFQNAWTGGFLVAKSIAYNTFE